MKHIFFQYRIFVLGFLANTAPIIFTKKGIESRENYNLGFNSANFSIKKDNAYFLLPVGKKWLMELR